MAPINLADVYIGLSDRWRDRPALVSGPSVLSYGELIARAARSARELREQSIAPGDKVGVATPDGAEAIVLMIALWMLRAVPVPIDFRSMPAERDALVEDFGLICMLEHRGGTDRTYRSIQIDESWSDVIARHDASPLHAAPDNSPASISLTSGTTGRPLGIVLSHSTLLFQLWLKDEIVTPDGRLLSGLPVHHSGSRNQILAQLLKGGTVFFQPPLFNAAEFARVVAETRATDVYSVPTMVRDLLKLCADRSSPLFDGVNMMFCGGAPMSPEEKKRARSSLCANIVEGYSSTMIGGITFLRGEDMDRRPESVGRVLPAVVLQIVDDEDRPLPLGESGIIRLRSPGMAHTTCGGATRAGGDRLKDGWAYPGDIGAVDRENFLTIHGRVSDVIIRGGVNVHPSEIEAVLAALPGVHDVAVVGYSVVREGEEIAAFVVADGGISEPELVAHCRTTLAPDKRPRKFVFVPRLPRNASGKILRTALVEQMG